jgi:hypothetical protein
MALNVALREAFKLARDSDPGWISSNQEDGPPGIRRKRAWAFVPTMAMALARADAIFDGIHYTEEFTRALALMLVQSFPVWLQQATL